MNTQSTVSPEANVPPARKSATDGRSTADTLDSAAPEVAGRMRQMVDSGKDRMNEWKGGFQEGVRAKPIQSVLIAAAVGAVIGLVFARRSR